MSVKVITYFTPEGARRLQGYLEERYGNRRMRSYTIERAVMWWIDLEEAHALDDLEQFIKARRN